MKKPSRLLKRERVPKGSQARLQKKLSFKNGTSVSSLCPAAFLLGFAAFFFLHAICAQALEDHGQSAGLLENAVRLRESGQIEKAEIEIKKALDFDPANFACRFELANIYAAQYDRMKSGGDENQSKERLEAASRELEQALMLQPGHLPARFNLGVVYKKQGRFEEARRHFREVMKLDSNQINALMQIGATYEEQGFFDEAWGVYQEAQERDFNNPGIRLALDELEKRKEEARQLPSRNSAADGFEKLARLRSPVYQPLREGDPNPNQDFRQAIPYLSAWLLQQFMKARPPKE